MRSLSISVFSAPDNSGVAIQLLPSYQVLFLSVKYESLVKAWRNSVNFPAISELDGDDFGLSKDDIAELTGLLSHNNLID